jgi:hypothetical protein
MPDKRYEGCNGTLILQSLHCFEFFADAGSLHSIFNSASIENRNG